MKFNLIMKLKVSTSTPFHTRDIALYKINVVIKLYNCHFVLTIKSKLIFISFVLVLITSTGDHVRSNQPYIYVVFGVAIVYYISCIFLINISRSGWCLRHSKMKCSIYSSTSIPELRQYWQNVLFFTLIECRYWFNCTCPDNNLARILALSISSWYRMWYIKKLDSWFEEIIDLQCACSLIKLKLFHSLFHCFRIWLDTSNLVNNGTFAEIRVFQLIRSYWVSSFSCLIF